MSVPSRILSLNEILERFYIREGILYRNSDINNHIVKDSPVGTLDKTSGYLRVKIDGKRFNVHRLMYQIYHNLEELPIHMQIEHSDGNKLNNSKENLKLVSNIETDTSSSDNPKYVGIFWEEKVKSWRAAIRFQGVKYFLGNYVDPIKAAERYDISAIRRDAKNHVLNFPEKKEKYLKYIEEHGIEIKDGNNSKDFSLG